MSREQLSAILEINAHNPPPPNAGPVELRVWFEGIWSAARTRLGFDLLPTSVRSTKAPDP